MTGQDAREEELHEEDSHARAAKHAGSALQRCAVVKRRQRADEHCGVGNELRREQDEDTRIELALHPIPIGPRALVRRVRYEQYRKETDEDPEGESVALAEALEVRDDCAGE